jgi:hypothetical protein
MISLAESDWLLGLPAEAAAAGLGPASSERSGLLRDLSTVVSCANVTPLPLRAGVIAGGPP